MRAGVGGALLLLGATPLAAQTVGGVVRDARTGGVVENATVALRNAADSTVAWARTDSAGVFYLTAPVPGTYALRINLGAGPERTTPPIELATAEAFHQRTFVVEVPNDPHFFEFQVDTPVRPRNDVSPPYPSALQARAVQGDVIAQFVVDTTGRAVPETFKVIASTDDAFTASVRSTLSAMRFAPAEVRGRRVRQLVQQAFAFRLTSAPRRTDPRWPPAWPPPMPGTRPPR